MRGFPRLQNTKTRFQRRAAPYGLDRALLMLLALTSLWADIAWNLTQEYRHAETSARTDASNLVRSIEAIDQQLLLLRKLYLRDRAHFDLSTIARSGYLLPDLTLQVTIIDRLGLMRLSNLGPITGPVDLSDREHIHVHMNGDAR